MNWLDNAISFLSPEWGAKREAWRKYGDEIRNYDAAGNGNGSANWRVMNQSAEATDRYNRDTVRARSRDLERNSDMLNSVVGAFKRNVFGGGFSLRAKTGEDSLNTELEKAWKRWCKKQNCDVTGTQSFNQIMRMCVQRKKVDGGILILKRYTSQGFIPFQLQTMEVDELDTAQVGPKRAGNRVVGGIEYNRWNRPMGYWFQQYDIEGALSPESIYVDAKDVIFYYSKRRPSQIREMSDLSPTVTRIRDANEFMTAVSVKERITACLSVFVKKYNPAGIGRINNDATKKGAYEGKTIAPGMIRELEPGDDVEVVNPNGQSTDATTFIKLLQHMIGAGQGLSYEATSRDMSETNYASARQGMIEDGLTYDDEKELLLEAMDEIYETFVISCVLAKIVQIPSFWENKEKYMEHTWTAAPKKWIDPAKEATANKTALNTGQKTFQQLAAENGRDWKEQLDETLEVLKYARENGLEMGGVIFGKDDLYQAGFGDASEGDGAAEGKPSLSGNAK
ncbi:phage portal protein [Eisenbergiella tayi]|uniref:phage portal protein n=1 Tax=Eisenbergiella tayi TaxID=1432052 RepID=UPI0008493839|nr:phage portal protein [Eisenbergiella tayi]ODR35489.1 phage portal protein [Eisenbergiella tayi]